MAGTIKLDGATFLEKDGGNYKITNTELKLKSSGNTIVDSSGNAVLSESGGNVSIGNVRLPTSGGIKDSSGNNILAENSGTVTLQGVTLGDSAVPSTPMMFRNLLINGSLDIWQRGTTNASVSNNYLADRFWTANPSSTDQSTDAPDGFNYSIKLTYGSTDMAIGQPIELFKTGNTKPFVAGETVTLSYYAKVDSGTEGVLSYIYFRDSKFSATNQSAFTYSNNVQTLTTSWQRFSMQFTVPAVNGTNTIAAFEIGGISKTAYFTGFQLEKGSAATPFEQRPIGLELSLCQRYCQVIKGLGGSGPSGTGFAINGRMNGANAGDCQYSFPHVMRASPSLSISFDSAYFEYGSVALTVSSMGASGSTPYGVNLRANTSGGSNGTACVFRLTGTTQVNISAEL